MKNSHLFRGIEKATCGNEFLLLFESIERIFSLISHEKMRKVIILSKASYYTASNVNAVLKFLLSFGILNLAQTT